MRKAKFLKTGEIVNIHNIDYCGNGQDYATIEKDGLMKNVSIYDLQFIDHAYDESSDNINWELRRYETAKAFLTGFCSGESYYSRCTKTKDDVKIAIEYADELIRQLK